MKNTLHYCMREQLKGMAIVVASVFFFVLFILFISASEGDSVFVSLIPGLLWQIFPVFAFVYFFSMQYSFARKESLVMLAMGETRRHIAIGRQFASAACVIEGAAIFLIGKALDTNYASNIDGYVQFTFMSCISLMIAGLGLGMIMSFIERKYGIIGFSISMAIIIFIIAILCFYGRFVIGDLLESYRFSAFVGGIFLLAIVLYVSGSLLSKLDIERMELRV